MTGKRQDLDSADDLRESIAHLDQVSARISRMLTELATRESTPASDDEDYSPAGT